MDCANRESIPQFFNTHVILIINTLVFEKQQIKIFVGYILDYDKNTQLATIEQRNYFAKGDIVEIFGPDKDAIELIIDK